MSSRSYVCFECRTSTRAAAAGGLKTEFRCRNCAGSLSEVSHRLSIPKQAAIKEWESLRMRVMADLEQSRKYHRETAICELAGIDRNIDTVSKRKPSANKESKFKTLIAKKRRTLDRYKGFIDDYE